MAVMNCSLALCGASTQLLTDTNPSTASVASTTVATTTATHGQRSSSTTDDYSPGPESSSTFSIVVFISFWLLVLLICMTVCSKLKRRNRDPATTSDFAGGVVATIGPYQNYNQHLQQGHITTYDQFRRMSEFISPPSPPPPGFSLPPSYDDAMKHSTTSLSARVDLDPPPSYTPTAEGTSSRTHTLPVEPAATAAVHNYGSRGTVEGRSSITSEIVPPSSVGIAQQRDVSLRSARHLTSSSTEPNIYSTSAPTSGHHVVDIEPRTTHLVRHEDFMDLQHVGLETRRDSSEQVSPTGHEFLPRQRHVAVVHNELQSSEIQRNDLVSSPVVDDPAVVAIPCQLNSESEQIFSVYPVISAAAASVESASRTSFPLLSSLQHSAISTASLSAAAPSQHPPS